VTENNESGKKENSNAVTPTSVK